MDISELVKGAKANTFSDLVPLPETKDGKNRELYEKTGLTAAEFHTQYPLLPLKNIFYLDSIIPQGLVYWDEKKMIYFALHIYNGKRMVFRGKENNEEFSKFVLETVKRLRYDREDRNYFRFLMPFDDAMRIEVLQRLIAEDGPSEELCEAFLSWYKSSDYGFGALKIDDVVQLLKYTPEKEKTSCEAVLAALPDMVTVYRGQGSESTPYDKAMSWTTSCDVAEFYATRLSLFNRYIVSGEYPKEKILFAYEADDADKELLLDPQYVKDVDIEEI